MALKVTTAHNDLQSSLNTSREFSVVRQQQRTNMTRVEQKASIKNFNKRIHNMKVDDGMNSTNTRFANLIDDSGNKMMRRSLQRHLKSLRGLTLNEAEMEEIFDDTEEEEDDFEQEVFKPRRESLESAKSRRCLMLPTDMKKDIATLFELVAEADEKEDAHDIDSSSFFVCYEGWWWWW